MTAHLVMPAGQPADDFLEQCAEELEHQFGIAHATLQIETGDGRRCSQASENVLQLL